MENREREINSSAGSFLLPFSAFRFPFSFLLSFSFCLFTFIFCLVSACGGPSERIKEISAKSPTPPPTPTERVISGAFKIEGAGANGLEPYSGSLTVTPKGETYEFRWTTTKGSRIGTGVQIGDAVAVSFAPTGGGKGCGVVVYKIVSDGVMDGRVGLWGEPTFAIEKAERTDGTSFAGKYEVTGTTADGKPYSGQLTTSRNGGGYEFLWKLDEPRVAFGTWQGSLSAASFGGRQCSFALFDVRSNGDLEGHWGSQREVTFGTESAKRQ